MAARFAVTTAAPDRGLLNLVELRAAAGVVDTSRDAELTKVGLTVSDLVSRWCGIAGDGLTPPTLRKETITETIRSTQCVAGLILRRRFLGTVDILLNGEALGEEAFEVDAAAGVLRRLVNDRHADWPVGKIVVVYDAGFEAVPQDLAEVASKMVARRTGAARDPMLKRERRDVAGIEQIENEYWVDANAAVDITPDMEDVLSAYRTSVIG